MAEPILQLSTTEFDRPIVVIDGERYEMRSPDEMSISMIREMSALGVRLRSFQGADGEERDYDDLEAATKGSVDLVMVDLPDDVRDVLTVNQLGSIVRTFTQLAKGGLEASAAD